MKTKLKDLYQSNDLNLVCVLSLTFPIEAIDRTNPHKATFLFKRSEQLEKLLESYWRRELKVEPQSLFAQLKIIKTRLYSER